ncbi:MULTISPECIES: ligase-associated DNA damage response endonuclease PdeM [unclassified Paracoccus (in: a-proteobacteria)]|uniref:ligase-associated DNA damage response endonuclease PdeM n=1 Tax=unclassified Paracoccus (in: a-proteobacteria) TaxID=2688777 RepID=UPI0012B2AEC9|nr:MULTISPECIES: ligase-associated DNA damage response endonuclease PdeM [unclassified Paracoccus (in: a-proteobacteria)]UXU75479.1 ligase-associated DNA damage response endonuclease PdeM [Paracoccus sp. SMMA_5]UXU81384.1 ligase-associated DNA damage response endonuclease PdeM [Paracoccus sp. SMMA_5_TC]
MSDYAFDFHGLRLVARAGGALWWPQGGWLIVADLHLGKSERMARRGGALLPPYETLATLERLGQDIAALAPQRVISLGDGFDDLAAAAALGAEPVRMLEAMARGRDWVWIGGNHDPGAPPAMPGRMLAELRLGAVTLRHQAGSGPDISGHYHPVLSLAGQRRRAFLLGRDHLILPAYGTYTGGLSRDDPALRALVPQGLGIACGRRALVVPLR